MTDDNGWKKWAAQAALTIILTALAAFAASMGGIRAGLSETRERLVRVETRQVDVDKDVARVEKKVDKVDDKVDDLIKNLISRTHR